MKSLTEILLVTLALASLLAFSKKPDEPEPVDFEVVLSGQHSSIDTAAVFMIDNDKDWTKIWGLAQGKIEPMPPVKEIDFDKYILLAVFMGQKNSAGFSTEVSEIARKGDELTVKVINHISGGGMMLPVLTTPFQIVQIPRGKYQLHVEYEEKKGQ